MRTLEPGHLEENRPIKKFLEDKRCWSFCKWKNNVEGFRYTVMHWNKTWNYLNHLSGNCIIFYCLVSILNFGSFETVSLSSNQRVARWPVQSRSVAMNGKTAGVMVTVTNLPLGKSVIIYLCDIVRLQALFYYISWATNWNLKVLWIQYFISP